MQETETILYKQIEGLSKRLRAMYLVFFLLAICIAILLFVIMVKAGSDGVKCVSNPMVYGAAIMQEKNYYPIQCRCDLLGPGLSETLWFNANKSWISSPDLPTIEYESVNITKLNISHI